MLLKNWNIYNLSILRQSIFDSLWEQKDNLAWALSKREQYYHNIILLRITQFFLKSST